MTRCLLIACLLLQSCSFKVPGWSRGPASIANFNDIKIKMTAFKGRAMGSEQDANCSKEQLDEDFKRLMASLKRDSCAEDGFTLNKEEFVQKNCPKKKNEGLFDRIIKKTIEEEKTKKPLTYFQNVVDPEFLKLFKEAQAYLKMVDAISEDENYSLDDRIDLISTYVENVLLPVRDLVVIKRSYVIGVNDESGYYKKLLPTIPTSMAQGLSTEQSGLLTLGPNPESNPFYMEIVPGEHSHLLNFSSAKIFRRDVLTLLKAPTSRNYVLALKWMTLHMMLSQVHLYDTILGTKSTLGIPNSCQNQFNGNLPTEFKFEEDDVGEQYLENILGGHGLIFKKNNMAYFDYFIDNVNNDPNKDGYSGIIPFENFKNAKMGLSNQFNTNPAIRPQFDDIAHFQSIMGFKASEALRVFKGTAEKRSRMGRITENVTFAGMETFKNILGTYSSDEIAEINLPDGTIQQIFPGKQNLSPYLLELMKQNGFVDYTQLITERMKKKFVGKKILIDFPTMYSSPIWRDWSLKLLADIFYQYRDFPTNSVLHRITQGSCDRTALSKEARGLCTGNRVQNISNLLNEFSSDGKYIPTRRLEERQFQNVYPLLSVIWTTLRDYTELTPETKRFELNFLLDQMAAGNPWARLKFSYMVALDQLEYQKEGIPPIYTMSGLWFETNAKAKCDDRSVNLQYKKIMEAGKVLGLNNPLTYGHADKLLSGNEKNFIWKKILEDINQRNAQLFSVTNGSKDFYKIIEDLSYKTILDQETALKVGGGISEKARKEIALVARTNEAQIGDFFLKLFKIKNDVGRQKKLFEEFSKINGIDSTFNLKLNFLAIDESYKKPIYKDILRQAAVTRKQKILSHLQTFCGMDVNNPAEFKNIFYSTSKAQNELNQIAGLPAVPEDLLKKINEMSPDEFRDMWVGIGSGIVGMASVIVGGACTISSGGICAPMIFAGVASLGIQVKLTGNELGRKLDADVDEKNIKMMEDLGFANTGSADEVHRSYLSTIIDGLSAFPLIGVANKSLIMGSKLITVSARSIMQQTGESAFKSNIKSVVQEEEVRAARYLLGFDSISKNLGLDGKSLDVAKTKITMIRKLYSSGEIDLETMVARIAKIIDPIKRSKIAVAKTIRGEVGKVFVKESKDQIDRQTSKFISQYFADNSKDMLRLINDYSGERLNKAIRIMREIESKERIGGRIPIYSGVRDRFMRMRNESLAKNSSKILRIQKELETLSLKPGELEKYIHKNIDDLTDIFIDIPMRIKEIPSIAVQGLPEFNFFQGKKIPILNMMSKGQTMKKIFTARARLVYESYKYGARIELKLKRYVQSEITLRAFQAFQHSVADLASTKTQQEASKIMLDYRKIEEKMTKRLYLKFLESGKKMEYGQFNSMITSPSNLKDRAISEAIWEAVPGNELLGIKEVGTLAHEVVQELATKKDADSLQDSYNAFRVLIMNLNPAVLETM